MWMGDGRLVVHGHGGSRVMAHHTHVRRSLVSFVLVSLFVGLVAPASAVLADASTYQDPSGAYRFTLPDGWQALPDGSSLAFGNTVTGSVLVIGTAPDNGLSLNDAARLSTGSFQQQPGYDAGTGGMTDLILGGQPAKGLSFHSNNSDGKPISARMATVINKDTLYLLLFISPQDSGHTSDADMATIITSWQFS